LRQNNSIYCNEIAIDGWYITVQTKKGKVKGKVIEKKNRVNIAEQQVQSKGNF